MKKEAVGPIGLVSSLVFSFTLDWILGVLYQGFFCLVAMYFVGDLKPCEKTDLSMRSGP